jgi:hypothetical protein
MTTFLLSSLDNSSGEAAAESLMVVLWSRRRKERLSSKADTVRSFG